MIPVIVIVGPTGVGKTDAAIALARRFRGEVVNADSRLVYRGMDIGTAKPSPVQRGKVPHHLIDLVEPTEPFTLTDFVSLATEVIEDVHRRDRLPLLAGGTGLYVQAIVEGLRAPEVPPNPELRRALEERARTEGTEALHEELRRRDPASAATVDPRNLRRLVRALEVCIETGQPFSELRRREPPPYDLLMLGLTLDRSELYRRLDRRVQAMVNAGWPQEAQRLAEAGCTPETPAMSALGYREMLAYAQGDLPLEEAVRRVQTATRRFARRQYAWFRPSDPRIHWIDVGVEPMPQAAERLVERFLLERGS